MDGTVSLGRTALPAAPLSRGRLDWWRWLVGFPGYRRAVRAARRAPAVRRLVIVGNAPLAFDCRELVDGADIVVRLNDCKGATAWSGTRTTILCVNHTGAPARRYVRERPFRSHPLCVDAREVWLPHHQGAYDAWRLATGRVLDSFEEVTEEVIRANSLEDRVLVRFSQEFNAGLFEMLEATMRRHQIPEDGFSGPSTGMFAVAYVLAAAAYRDYEVHLIGFRFKGWEGHPWQTERRVIADCVRAGRLNFHRT
jgi:hypothetical protein